VPLRRPLRVRARPAGLDTDGRVSYKRKAALARRPHPPGLRTRRVPAQPGRIIPPMASPRTLRGGVRSGQQGTREPPRPGTGHRPRRRGDPSLAHCLLWADLLRRVFAQDVLACSCGGRRTVVAFVTDPCRDRPPRPAAEPIAPQADLTSSAPTTTATKAEGEEAPSRAWLCSLRNNP